MQKNGRAPRGVRSFVRRASSFSLRSAARDLLLHEEDVLARDRISEHGRIAPSAILNTGLFDFEKAALAPGWMKELRGEHTPETKVYGISSFVYRARRPFHPQRFWDFLLSGWKGVLPFLQLHGNCNFAPGRYNGSGEQP